MEVDDHFQARWGGNPKVVTTRGRHPRQCAEEHENVCIRGLRGLIHEFRIARSRIKACMVPQQGSQLSAGRRVFRCPQQAVPKRAHVRGVKHAGDHIVESQDLCSPCGRRFAAAHDLGHQRACGLKRSYKRQEASASKSAACNRNRKKQISSALAIKSAVRVSIERGVIMM